ncbi:MAG: BACON domain-containing protein [Candidatus Cryptobacteroides sp.]
MRHRLSLLSLIVTPLLLSVACQKEDESGIHDTAVIQTVLPAQPAQGATKAVTIFATCGWTLEGEDWFTVEPAKGGQGISESVISISPNNSGAERTGTIRIKAGTYSGTYTFKQKSE